MEKIISDDFISELGFNYIGGECYVKKLKTIDVIMSVTSYGYVYVEHVDECNTIIQSVGIGKYNEVQIKLLVEIMDNCID